MTKEHAGLLPMNAMMGWNEGLESKGDAIELAKGFISQRYTAVEASWYTVAPFMGGYLWEVHHGGPGKGYIQSVIKALSETPDGKFWFPSGDRAFQVMMRDGKPFGILLSKAESLSVMNSGQPPLAAVAKMQRAVRRGTATFLAGASILASGVIFLAGSMAFYAVSANPGPSLRPVDFSKLPHAQWGRVGHTAVEEVVSKLEFSNGKWSVVTRPHVVPGLKELRGKTQEAIRGARGMAAPMPEENPDVALPGTAPDEPRASPEADDGHMSPADRRRILRERALRHQQVRSGSQDSGSEAEPSGDGSEGGTER